MADIAALTELGIGISGHVGHVRPGRVAVRAGGGGSRSRIHQEVRGLYREKANWEDRLGAGEMAHLAIGSVAGPAGQTEGRVADATEVGGADLIGGAGG